jgi:hypothetical protein
MCLEMDTAVFELAWGHPSPTQYLHTEVLRTELRELWPFLDPGFVHVR